MKLQGKWDRLYTRQTLITHRTLSFDPPGPTARTDDVDTVSPPVFAEFGNNGGCISSIQSAGGQFRLKYDVVWFVREACRPDLLASVVLPPLKRG